MPYAGRFSYVTARSDGPECEEYLAAAAKAKSKGGREISGLLIFSEYTYDSGPGTGEFSQKPIPLRFCIDKIPKKPIL